MSSNYPFFVVDSCMPTSSMPSTSTQTFYRSRLTFSSAAPAADRASRSLTTVVTPPLQRRASALGVVCSNSAYAVHHVGNGILFPSYSSFGLEPPMRSCPRGCSGEGNIRDVLGPAEQMKVVNRFARSGTWHLVEPFSIHHPIH